MGKKWSSKDIKELKELKLRRKTNKEIVLILSRTEGAVEFKSRKLNIKKPFKNPKIRKLLKLHNSSNLKELSKKLGVSHQIVKNWSCGITAVLGKPRQKKIKIPEKSEKLAEFFGIILGDGNIIRKQMRVVVNKNEKMYLGYVQKLVKDLFDLESKIHKHSRGGFENSRDTALELCISSISLVKFCVENGLKIGNKIENQANIPRWCFENDKYLKGCVRGLFDTDGSVYPNNKRWKQICWKMSEKSKIPNSIYQGLKQLGFHPNKNIDNRVNLTRTKEVHKFFDEIKPKNPKHIKRMMAIGK